jgi:hypothetical protein
MNEAIESIIAKYYESFTNKSYSEENLELDILMNMFGITQELKQENKQYWGRELGMVWEQITKEIIKNNNTAFRLPESTEFGSDKPVDYFVGNMAVDTKYRVGSGDAGTLKKFKEYGRLLTSRGYQPVFLILRTDNLQAAITAAETGGWTVYRGQESIDFIKNNTNSSVDIVELFANYRDRYFISR